MLTRKQCEALRGRRVIWTPKMDRAPQDAVILRVTPKRVTILSETFYRTDYWTSTRSVDPACLELDPRAGFKPEMVPTPFGQRIW